MTLLQEVPPERCLGATNRKAPDGFSDANFEGDQGRLDLVGDVLVQRAKISKALSKIIGRPGFLPPFTINSLIAS